MNKLNNEQKRQQRNDRIKRARLKAQDGIPYDELWDDLDSEKLVSMCDKDTYKGNMSKDGLCMRNGMVFVSDDAPEYIRKSHKKEPLEYKPTAMEKLHHYVSSTMVSGEFHE